MTTAKSKLVLQEKGLGEKVVGFSSGNGIWRREDQAGIASKWAKTRCIVEKPPSSRPTPTQSNCQTPNHKLICMACTQQNAPPILRKGAHRQDKITSAVVSQGLILRRKNTTFSTRTREKTRKRAVYSLSLIPRRGMSG